MLYALCLPTSALYLLQLMTAKRNDLMTPQASDLNLPAPACFFKSAIRNVSPSPRRSEDVPLYDPSLISGRNCYILRLKMVR
jgi:hypothetical protein